MKVLKGIIAAMLVLMVFAASPAWSQQTDSERAALARYQHYAKAPVDRVRYFQINGFQYLAPDTVAVWFGVNQLYLLKVQTPCINLAYTDAIGLTSKSHTLHRNFDAVTFGDNRCRILQIVPVDELQMKQDNARAAPATSGR